MKKIKQIIASAVLICVCISVLSISSCSNGIMPSSENNDKYLKEILKDYRVNGMNSLYDILAVYNADENPLDYKNFDAFLAKVDKDSYAAMVEYCIAVDIAVIIGADEGYFENYQPYLKKLKDLVENMNGGEEVTIRIYCLAYYALTGANIFFSKSKFIEYLKANQKSDSGFAISGDTGDVDITSLVLPALKHNVETFYDLEPESEVSKYIIMKKNEENTLPNSKGEYNAVSTAYAVDALISYFEYTTIEEIYEALALFKVKKGIGYSYLREKNAQPDPDATSATAIAISSVKNKMSVWDKLIEEAKEVEPVF